jgi:hypothetical protein
MADRDAAARPVSAKSSEVVPREEEGVGVVIAEH